MNDSPAVLSLSNVCRRLSGRSIVEDLNLEIARGEVLGLLGVNGAGKSTALRMMAGILAPGSGTVRIDGQELAENPQLARHAIGYLPEEPPLYGELSVEEFLMFCAHLHGLRGASAASAVQRVIEQCELGEVRKRLTSLLSKGFRQRVGLAQAIIHEPALIVLDEPASGLDPIQAIRLRDLVRRLSENHAVVLSTHVLSDVLACCTRVAIMHRGRLRHSASLLEMDSGGTLLVRLTRQLNPQVWSALPIVASADAIDAHRWRIRLRDTATPGDLAALINQRDFGLEELRPDNNALESMFVRIASESEPMRAPA